MARDKRSLSSLVAVGKCVETETSRGERQKAEPSLECNSTRFQPTTCFSANAKFSSTNSAVGRQLILYGVKSKINRDYKKGLQISKSSHLLKENKLPFERRIHQTTASNCKRKRYSPNNTTITKRHGRNSSFVEILSCILILVSLQFLHTSVICKPSEDSSNSLQSVDSSSITSAPEFEKAKFNEVSDKFKQTSSAILASSPTTPPTTDALIASTPPTTTTTTTTETTTAREDDTGVEHDDNNAEGCEGISNDGSEEAKNITDNERLVNLQTCFQRKIRRQLMSASRSGIVIFEQLTLTGGCSASLFNLMTSLGEIKSFAFKFLDASAKIPSGMMYGLLSDYGDFDECLSIKSNPAVSFEDEQEEGTYSGKYCLMSLKLNYHVTLAPNSTVPDGISPDGVFWDKLVRNYWTSKSPKGFQVGMCFPSRCTNDDLEQIFKHVAASYNIVGDMISCQDGHDLKRQYNPDIIQRAIICSFYTLLVLTVLGTFIDRYYPELANCHDQYNPTADSFGKSNDCIKCGRNSLRLATQTLICFSIIKNWATFMRKDRDQSRSHPSSWDCLSNSPVRTFYGCSNETETDLSGTEIGSMDKPTSSEIINSNNNQRLGQLTVKIRPEESYPDRHRKYDPLNHLSGLRLLVITWITIGYSFLYPSANNYQHYRSIISMNVTQNSVWFATTNFTLGIDMLLYMTGFVFVYKLAHLNQAAETYHHNATGRGKKEFGSEKEILRSISKKILRFWPTYLTVIALAIVTPLLSDGPMWPEMVSKRIGESCRQNWWANLLFINNYSSESQICLPSSWFVSVLMQCFLIGSIIIVLVRKISLKFSMSVLSLLIIGSSLASFSIAYQNRLRAPAIKMDESFVMDIDGDIFRLYTNILNNLGPFLVGMVGGFLLIKSQINSALKRKTRSHKPTIDGRFAIGRQFICDSVVAIFIASIGVVVLSSVFFDKYSLIWSSIYWSLHRIGWAIVTGYIIHNCATGRWKLINDLLSLSTFIPLSRLIFITYLVYPIFIHIHSGLVRDGLHISIYNMLNIYITRLVMTFITALLIHLLVELPFCSIEEMLLNRWIWKITSNSSGGNKHPIKSHLLLAVAPLVYLNFNDIDKTGKEVTMPSSGGANIEKGDYDNGKLDEIIEIS